MTKRQSAGPEAGYNPQKSVNVRSRLFDGYSINRRDLLLSS